MDLLKYINKETLLIVPNNIRKKVINYFAEKSELFNIKLMTLEEVKKHFYFDYDVRAVLYLMDNYHLEPDIAYTILELLYLVDDKEYTGEKLLFLSAVKEALLSEGLLFFDPLFKEFIKRKQVLVYGYSKIDKFSSFMLDEVKATIICNDSNCFSKKEVCLFSTLEEEVEYVFKKISSLIADGISPNKIKLVNIDEKYYYTIRRYSEMFSLPILINDNYIYSSVIVKRYLDILLRTKSFMETLNNLKDEFDLSKESNLKIYNSLFEISNIYNDLDYTFENIYKLVCLDIKKLKLKAKDMSQQIEICELENNVFDDDYVFLLGFNQGVIPAFYKDEDYLSDLVKETNHLLCETTVEKNKLSKNSVIVSLNNISNLFISAPEKSISNEFMVSNLASELGYSIVRGMVDYRTAYSLLNLKLNLTKYLDDFIKYGVINPNLSLLYGNINIDYLSYNNKFTGLNKDVILNKFSPKLTLSYTHIDNYFHCAFRYYLTNILKLDKYEENFSAVIGNLFHYILSICFTKGFEFEVEYDTYVNNLSLSHKERFFLNKLKRELRLVIDQVLRLHNETGLTKLFLEHKISIDKTSIIPVVFIGVVDKIMYREKEETLVSIIDYKTGKTEIDLYNVIYGLSMQLPIYLYLVKKSKLFKNVRFTGFYLQKILSSEVSFSPNKNYLTQKNDNLKLEGYSTDDVGRLEVFIPDYEDSSFVRAMKVTSKGFYHYAKVLSDIEIDNLISLVDKKIDEARDSILAGKFDINPKQIGIDKVGCDFCHFKDICFKTNNDFKKLPVNKSLSFLGGDNNA